MIEVRYTISPQSPMRVATGIGEAGFLDNTIVRDRLERALVPGSSVKGKTRATAYRLASAFGIPVHPMEMEMAGCQATDNPCAICRIFGAAQWPGLLHFDNATLHSDFQLVLDTLGRDASHQGTQLQAARNLGRHVRTSLALERRRRVALGQRLFRYEAVETPALFQGAIRGQIRQASSDYRELALLVAALKALTHLGGARGRGLGRCEIELEQIRIDEQILNPSQLLAVLASSGEQS